MSEYENIYLDMVMSNYSSDEVRIYFLVKYQIDISEPEYQFSKKRIGQEEFRQKLAERYDSKCILTNTAKYEACHIVPFSDTHNMSIDNGLLLNSQHHKLFDDYIWSINPQTLCIEINYSLANSNDVFIRMIQNKHLPILRSYPNTIKYLTKHYEKFKKY
jgi:predicted restriction endonuclease